MAVGEPRRVLIIDPDASPALRLHEEIMSIAGGRVWLWHELSFAHALTALSVAHFDVVLLDPNAGDEPWVETVREVRRLAPDATVVAFGQMASEHSVPKEDPSEAARILLRLLGLAVRRDRSD